MKQKDKYILTIDEGTSSCRAIVFDHNGSVVGISQQEFTQHFPKTGWVEHDAIEIWETQKKNVLLALEKAKVRLEDIEAVGITNQRETVVVWDKITGLPIYNAIVWQDGRTSKVCQKLIAEGHQSMFSNKTGLVINPYFSGTKLQWILENVPKAKELLKENKLLAGTIDTWLIWKLTNGKVHATDVSNASRTLLFNIKTQVWDDDILKLLAIPKAILPEVKASSGFYGYVVPTSLDKNISNLKLPITGVIGDQQGALFGQLCTNVGDLKNTYGTGCFTLVNTGTKIVKSKNNLLTTIAWKIGQEETVYAIEGSVFVGGAVLQWLRDSLRLIDSTAISDFYTKMANKDQSVYVVPAFTGLGAPYWDSSAKGAIFGLERGTNKADLVKASLESIAYQSNDLIMAMSKDLGKKITKIAVDGGASKSDYLMQFQASISDLTIERPKNIESTALGAAFLAGLATNYWTIDKINQIRIKDKIFTSKFDQKTRNSLLKGWGQAIKRSLNWTKDIKV